MSHDATDPDESPSSYPLDAPDHLDAEVVARAVDDDQDAPDDAVVVTVEVDGLHSTTIRDGVISAITRPKAYTPVPSVDDAIEDALRGEGLALVEYRTLSLDTRLDHAGDQANVEDVDATIAFDVVARELDIDASVDEGV